MCKNFIENNFAGIEFVLYLQPALKNNRVVLRKVNQKSLEGQKESRKKIKKNFAGIDKPATFALPSKKWVQRKAEKIFEMLGNNNILQ